RLRQILALQAHPVVGILLCALDLRTLELVRRDGIHALDAGSHLTIGDALHLQFMKAAKFGDLLEGQGGVLDQPDGSRLGHEGIFLHDFLLRRRASWSPSPRLPQEDDSWLSGSEACAAI